MCSWQAGLSNDWQPRQASPGKQRCKYCAKAAHSPSRYRTEGGAQGGAGAGENGEAGSARMGVQRQPPRR